MSIRRFTFHLELLKGYLNRDGTENCGGKFSVSRHIFANIINVYNRSMMHALTIGFLNLLAML